MGGDRATAAYKYICKSRISPKFMCGLVHNGGARCGGCRIGKR
jgi:hypothetical protein